MPRCAWPTQDEGFAITLKKSTEPFSLEPWELTLLPPESLEFTSQQTEGW